MDVDTASAIERLGERIDALEASLRSEFRAGLSESGEALHARFRAGLAESGGALRAEFRAGLAESGEALGAEFRAGLTGLRDELKDEILESRRHAQVLFESTRDHIRMIADAVALISARLDTRS